MLSGNNRIAAIVGVVILVGIGFFLFNPFNSNSDSTSASPDPIAVIETTYGIIVIQLFPDVAPGHVDNFVRLANEGYYDGTTFHRVIPGFMIQGGDPNSKDDDRSNDGQGGHSANGPNTFVNAEFSQDLTHKRGILSMARAQDPNSYSIFGEVIEGMDVADKIVNVKKDSADNPLEKITMKVTIRS